MSLEEREAEWAEMLPIEAEQEYGVGMGGDMAVDQADADAHQGAEKSRDVEMEKPLTLTHQRLLLNLPIHPTEPRPASSQSGQPARSGG